jgi:hypothetical protein
VISSAVLWPWCIMLCFFKTLSLQTLPSWWISSEMWRVSTTL